MHLEFKLIFATYTKYRLQNFDSIFVMSHVCLLYAKIDASRS